MSPDHSKRTRVSNFRRQARRLEGQASKPSDRDHHAVPETISMSMTQNDFSVYRQQLHRRHQADILLLRVRYELFGIDAVIVVLRIFAWGNQNQNSLRLQVVLTPVVDQ